METPSYGIGSFFLSFVLPWLTLLFLIAFPIFSLFLWKSERNQPTSVPPVSVEVFLTLSPEDTELRRLVGVIRSLKEQIENPDPRPTDPELERLQATYMESFHQYNERAQIIRNESVLRLDALAIILIVTTLTPVLQFALNDTPWLPAEVVSTTKGSKVIGYVLSTNDGWTTVLSERDRLVLSIRSENVASRSICAVSEGTNGRATIYQHWGQAPSRYAKCSTTITHVDRRPSAPSPPSPTSAPSSKATRPQSTSSPASSASSASSGSGR